MSSRDSGNVIPQRVPGWQRVLNLLDDRGWHSSYELATTCSVLTHSRIAECRSKGYDIESRRVAGEEGLRAFEYRLVGTPGAGEPRGVAGLSASDTASGDPCGAAAVSSPAPGAPTATEVPLDADGTGAPLIHDGQLSLEVAA